MRTVSFGERLVGDGQPCFITFEAGPTHNGLESAKALCTAAAEAGGDAVKFQVLDPDRLVADRTLTISYEVLVDRDTGRTETVSERLHDVLCRRVLSEQEWRAVKRHCDELNLAFFATATFDAEVDLLASLGCHSIKIASADVNNLPFIRRVARTGTCVQLDTGNSTIGEIEAAVDAARLEENEDIIIHQCPSGYPARLESINLNIIRTLKQMFPFPVAYSDHTPGWVMDVAALAVGANLVEKTLTFDRTTRSIEHIFSVEPAEAKEFVRVMREVEVAMGGPRRIMHPEELERRTAMRRSTFLSEAAKAGQQVKDIRVDFRRPGDGLAPDEWERLGSHVLKGDLPAGHKLSLADLA